MLAMAVRKILHVLLAVVFIASVISHITSKASPISSDAGSISEPSRTRDTTPHSNNSYRDDICANKGKFCEIICKNNPSEGGKMCNCDAYALRSDPALHYICKKSVI